MKQFTEKDWIEIDKIIDGALKEDVGSGDITTEAVFESYMFSTAVIIAKDDGVLAGIEVAKRIFEKINSNINFKIIIKDGEKIFHNSKVAEVSGDIRSVLKAERTVLNFLGRMSGIATLTNKFVEKIKKAKTKILDTRKTTPLIRILEKYAVSAGGGYNHRCGLYDMFLIKENHIEAAGGIDNAIKKAVEYKGKKGINTKIEVEAENIEQVKLALEKGVERIMLDNMKIEDMKKAAEIAKGKVEIEVSGNVNLDNVLEIASIGVDYISVGALTHSAKNFDFTLLLGNK